MNSFETWVPTLVFSGLCGVQTFPFTRSNTDIHKKLRYALLTVHFDEREIGIRHREIGTLLTYIEKVFLRENSGGWVMEEPFSGQAEKLCAAPAAAYIIIRHRGARLKDEIRKQLAGQKTLCDRVLHIKHQFVICIMDLAGQN